MKKQILRKFMGIAVAAMIAVTMQSPVQVKAAEKFDPVFYATVYADVAAVFGTDAQALYNHYITFGQKEGRMPYARAAGGEAVDGIADTATVAAETPAVTNNIVNDIIAINKLQNYTSLKKKMTDTEFQTAYNEALKIV